MNTIDLRVQDIFCEIAELAPEERSARLESLCKDDPGLKEQVLSLLGHHDVAEGHQSFLDGDHLRDLLDTPIGAKLSAGARIGQYSVLYYLGGGGMGDVYAVEQERPKRSVALKVIRPGLATPRLLRLFERETEVLGRLTHPGIARVFEAGIADYGYGPQPFLAMELIDGPPLTEFLKANNLSVAQRLELFAQICDAVQHAHQRGVIHRDLKPGNILVETNDDGSPIPKYSAKVLDFGVARTVASTGSGTHATTIFTSPGALIGTLAYMSPEQLAGDQSDIDTRSDVYSLGVVLYRMLSGRLPHDITNLPSHEAIRRICDEAPARLSTISKEFKGDIDTIVSRACEKDRTRRYASASDLASDIRRCLAGQPIVASQDSAFYVLTRQIKRYRRNVLLASAVVVFMVAAAVFAVMKASQESAARKDAQFALADAQAQRKVADDAALTLQRQLRESDIRRARLLAASGRLGFAENILEDLDAGKVAEDSFGTWARREVVSRSHAATTIPCNGVGLSIAAIGTDRCILAKEDGSLSLFSLESGTAIKEWRAHNGRAVRVLPLGDERVVSAGDDGAVRVWSVADCSLLSECYFPARQPIQLCIIDDQRMAVGLRSGKVSIVRISDGAVLQTLIESTAAVLSIDAEVEADLLVIGNEAGHVVAWRISTGEQLVYFRGNSVDVRGLSLTQGGKELVTVGRDRAVTFWETSGWTKLSSEVMNNGWIGSTQTSPDGSVVAVGGWWRCDLLNAETRTRLPFSLSEPAADVCFSEDGQTLITLSNAAYIRVWRMQPIGEHVIARHDGVAMCTDVLSDGRSLVSSGADMLLRVVDLQGEWPERSVKLNSAARHIQAIPHSTSVALALENQDLAICDVSDGSVRLISKLPGRSMALAVTGDGAAIFTGCSDSIIRKFDVASGKQIAASRPGSGETLGLALSPDQKTLAVTGRVVRLGFFDPITLEPVLITDRPIAYWSGRFSKDSKYYIGGTWRPSIEITEVETGKLVRTLFGHLQLVTVAMPSTSGTEIYSVGLDGAMKVWSAETGSELASFETGMEAYWLTPVEDGFVAPLVDGTVRRWRFSEMDSRLTHLPAPRPPKPLETPVMLAPKTN